MKRNSELLKPLFCTTPTQLTSDDMMKLFRMNYSDEGSNDRHWEGYTVYGLELFFQSIEGNIYVLGTNK